MATSLIGGLLQNGVNAAQLRVADPSPDPLAAKFPITLYTNNAAAIADADVIVLAVKPQVLPQVSHEIATALGDTTAPPLFISIAAGIRSDDLTRWLGVGRSLPIVRVMPNTPALVQSAASALYASQHVSAEQHELAENILRAVGLTLWVTEEAHMDAVTALSGSGPAYFFLVMEVLEKAGINLGLPQETARLLTLQTAFGAAKMALESEEDAATLRTRVTSKGGTTEQAINALQQGGMQTLFDEALQAAARRATFLAEQFGEQA